MSGALSMGGLRLGKWHGGTMSLGYKSNRNNMSQTACGIPIYKRVFRFHGFGVFFYTYKFGFSSQPSIERFQVVQVFS